MGEKQAAGRTALSARAHARGRSRAELFAWHGADPRQSDRSPPKNHRSHPAQPGGALLPLHRARAGRKQDAERARAEFMRLDKVRN